MSAKSLKSIKAFDSIASTPDFPAIERELLDHWYKDGIVESYLHRNDSSDKRFSFFDGPITANNPMGVHHGWGRTYKDLWQRYWSMRGYKQRHQNGFDCQGLWVEVEVEKELRLKNKRDIENLIPGDPKKSISKFVDLCKARVNKFSQVQTQQSKRLGYFMDWDHSYYTMSDENNYMIWHFLKRCHEKGWIYKGRDSVAWCPRCQTAISQHEMLTEDYKEVVHESVFVKFPILNRENEYLLVWTTTPWTIPANIAVAVDSKMDYVLVNTQDGLNVWVIKESYERVVGNDVPILKTVKGKELVGIKYQGPYDDLPAVAAVGKSQSFHTVIPTDPLILPISSTEGTGLVHTAVSAGQEDFRLGKKLGLSMIPVINDEASYLEGLGELTGKNAKKHPEIILDYLKKNNWAFRTQMYKHRYPACWRCKTELVWKVTDEWYIAMDVKEKSKTKTLRQQMIEVAKKITWIPKFGLDRELDWLTNMHDWLISKKNRYWGLALPIWEDPKTNEFEVIGGYDELKKRAVASWEEFEGKSPHKPFIDDIKIKSDKTGKILSRTNDVGNVWLDAGIIPFSTLVDPKSEKLSYITDKKYFKEWFPANFITESFPGQFKNWFYSLIAMATVLENKNPFETVLGYGSVLGEDGRPMHKSWGNAIEFNEAADKIGVDVMRWMYASATPESNLLFGYHRADETRRKFHLMVWNLYNFFVTYANYDKWIPLQSNTSVQLSILDKWIRSRLAGTVQTVRENFDRFDAAAACASIEHFVEDFSTWYIRRSRDRVGPSLQNEMDSFACHQTVYYSLIALCLLSAPVIPFLSDYLYTRLTAKKSVHLENYPETNSKDRNEKLEYQMNLIRQAAELGHSLRKKEKLKIRQPLSTFWLESKQGENLPLEILDLLKSEINVKTVRIEKLPKASKNILIAKNESISIAIDIEITSELKEESDARELIRQIQAKRKEMGFGLNDRIRIFAPNWPDKFKDMIVKKSGGYELTRAATLTIEKI